MYSLSIMLDAFSPVNLHTRSSKTKVPSRSLDLKRSLTLQTLTITICCSLLAAAFALSLTYYDLKHLNQETAEIVGKQLQIQLVRIQSHIGVAWPFPDWDPVTERVQAAGQCIEYIEVSGAIGRSSCVGSDATANHLPNWFITVGSGLLGHRLDVEIPVTYRDVSYGTVVVKTDPRAALSTMWRQVSSLLGMTAIVLVAISGLLYIAIARALRPTKDILAGLEKLERGDLSCRMPAFRLVELNRISEVFNGLVASLDKTSQERTALATRLVDGHEKERLELARELHDDLAQTLSAMNAIAASIKTTAEAECPKLVPEAASLMQTSMSVMKSFRTTLHSLRPPEIDDFGLAASLAALVREHERTRNTRILLNMEEAIQDLSPTASAHVYRIVQEGLTNVAKHAQGSQASVSLATCHSKEALTSGHQWLEVIIENKTHCLPISAETPVGSGLGLIGVRERIIALGGHLEISNRGQQGFLLCALIPFEPQSENNFGART